MDVPAHLIYYICLRYACLELRTSSYESLTSFVAFVLGEVLDEASSEVFSLLFPLASAVVSVAWVEDLSINARKFSWNYEVEERNGLGRSLVD